VREQRGRDAQGRTYPRYRSRDCSGCALRAQCTESARGRTLKRYRGEEYKTFIDRFMWEGVRG